MVWVIVGAVIATVVSKVYGVVRSPGGVQGWVRRLHNHLLRIVLCCCHVAPSMAHVCVWLHQKNRRVGNSTLTQRTVSCDTCSVTSAIKSTLRNKSTLTGLIASYDLGDDVLHVKFADTSVRQDAIPAVNDKLHGIQFCFVSSISIAASLCSPCVSISVYSSTLPCLCQNRLQHC